METRSRTHPANGAAGNPNMRWIEPKTAGSVTSGLVCFALAKGVPMAKIMAATNIRGEDLVDPNARLAESHVPTLMNLLAEQLPGHAFPLEIADVVPASILGAMAKGIESAPSLRDAIDLLVDYGNTLSDRIEVSVSESADELYLNFFHPMDAADMGAAAELGSAIFFRIFCNVYDREKHFRRLEFRHKPIGAPEQYCRFFGKPVLFEQPTNRAVIEKNYVGAANRRPDPLVYEYVQRHLDLLRQRVELSVVPDELHRVREAIFENAKEAQYGASELARRLGMSRRSLQRLLNRHGRDVRSLIEEVREVNAKRLLANANINIESVSFLLGYSDDRAFRRAFKRWTDQTPAQYRQAQLADPKPVGARA